jgi:CRP/FNR family transcriptional regulator, cyclic AMP receptor protein
MLKRQDQKIDRLAQVPLFSACTKKELRELAKITTDASASAGQILCKENETGSECYIVVDGQAAVTIGGQHVATIKSGGFFGEMALLDGGPRIATVTAATDMDLLVLSRREFLELIDQVPSVTRRLLEGLGARLRDADLRLHPSRLGV